MPDDLGVYKIAKTKFSIKIDFFPFGGIHTVSIGNHKKGIRY